MLVFLFFQEGIRPRAIARLEWATGAMIFVEFPELEWEELKERVRKDVLAFSTQYHATISKIDIPRGCSPEALLAWIQAGKERDSSHLIRRVES